MPRTRAGIQRKLDVFRGWYNTERPMLVLNGRTPEEMWSEVLPPHGWPILAHEVPPPVSVHRTHYGSDPNLIKLDIRVMRTVRLIA